MMKPIVTRSFLLAAAALMGTACSSGGGGSGTTTPPPPVNLELDTWWQTLSDTAGINAVVDIHMAAHPNVTVNVISQSSQATLDAAVNQRLMTGSPPSAAQANLGPNAQQFAGSALALTSPWTQASTLAFSPGVLATVSQGTKVIGVPLGLTRQNAAYYNWKVISGLAAPLNAIPVGTAAFASWVQGVAAAGYTHPLCFGFKDAWVNAHILFEDVVPGLEGLSKDKAYWTGNDTTGGQMMIDALNWAKTYIYPYLTQDVSTMTMGVGIDRLFKPYVDPTTMMPDTSPAGTCLMTAMGDWGGHQLLSPPDNYVAGTPDATTYTATVNGMPMTKNVDFVGTGFPGAENLVVFGGDAMVAFQGTGNEADVAALFDTMASPAGQVEFAALKGEMPARIDLANTSAAAQFKQLPILIQANVKALGMPNGAVPGYKVMGQQPKQYNSDIATQAQNFFLSGDPTALLAYMSANYTQIPKVALQ